MMKRVCHLLMWMCALAPAAAFGQTPAGEGGAQAAVRDIRLASFSPQRAFSESAEGKAGIARLTALQTEKARQIDEKNKALQTEEQTLQQSANALSDEARIRRTREVEQFRIDVQRFIQDAQAEVTGAQREVESSFLVKLRPAVEKIARDRGLLFVFDLDGAGIAWSEPTLDITADVIKQLALAATTKR
jgi:outer membrane protein